MNIHKSYLPAAVITLIVIVVGGSAPASGRSPIMSPSIGAPDSFQNPVIDRNFADPGVVRTDDAWYAYATGDLTVNIQVARSSDLVTWERVGEALPRLPFWQPSAKGLTWAPEVVRVGEGYVMYYTGRDVQAGKQCLSTATATAPEGPFVDESDAPLLCQVELGGSIDPYPFVAGDGTRYLLWKNDGNCCGLPTRIWMQRLSDYGLEVTGEAVDLGVRDDAPWEGALIEAPTLVEHEGRFYLFYSANAYDSADYAIGYAVAERLLGPYRDAADDPLVASGEGAAGPGGQAIVTEPDGDQWLLYHAWDAQRIGDDVGGRRALWLDPLRFEAGRPIVEGPNGDPQPLPGDR